MIKAIIFDLGGVLFTNGTKTFIDSFSKRFNIDGERVKEVMYADFGTSYREGKITKDEFWARFLKELHVEADPNELEKEWIDGYTLVEETRDLIQELSKKYKIFFLSDNVKSRVTVLNERYNFLSWFEGGVFSHEAGVRKPNPQIYKIVLQKAGVKPEEAVFIDDTPKMLPPAQEMGILTFAFESPEKLREDLRNNKILD